MEKPAININTPYSQTIDAAFKMLRLCGVTYNVVDGIIFVIGRDGLVYNMLAASTEYNPAQPDPTPAKPAAPTPTPAPAKPAAPIPTRTRQTALPLPDAAQVTHSEEKNAVVVRPTRGTPILARENIPVEARLKFRKKVKTRLQTDVFEPSLIHLRVGDVAQVPIANIPEGVTPERMRSSMSSWACSIWGKGSHRTCLTDTHIELLRIK